MDAEVPFLDITTRGIKCSLYRIIRNRRLREKIKRTAKQVSRIMILAAFYVHFRLMELTLSNNLADLQSELDENVCRNGR